MGHAARAAAGEHQRHPIGRRGRKSQYTGHKGEHETHDSILQKNH